MDKRAVNGMVEALRRRRDAEEMQPWRCVVCNTAVRRGRNDPCRCHPKEHRER